MISVINAGTEYPLDDGTYCRFIGADGLGAPPSHRQTERGSLQHGVTDKDLRLDPRVFSIVLEIEGTSLNDLYQKRADLIDILGPTPSGNPLIFKFETYTTRYLNAYFWDNGEMGYQDKSGFTQKGVFVFYAPTPVFYNANLGVLSLNLGGGPGGGAVPTAVPTPVGTSVADISTDIEYPGNWESIPERILLYGPITDPILTNSSTGEVLDFTGYTIADGDYYEIIPSYGVQTVKDSSGTDHINELSKASDLSTFHLGVSPEVPGGNNSLGISGTGINSNSELEVYWTNYYKGI